MVERAALSILAFPQPMGLLTLAQRLHAAPLSVGALALLLVLPASYLAGLAYARARGRIVLGRSGLRPVYVKPEPGHVVIYGRTGSGKSNTAMVIVSELSKRVPVMVLDWHGEYVAMPGFKVLVPGNNFSINPLEHRCGQLSEHMDFLVDLFGDVYHFTEPQRYMFRVILKQLYSEGAQPTLSQFMELLEEVPIRSYYDHEIKMALKRRLSGLTEGRAGRALSQRSTMDLSELFSSSVVIDLSVFRSLYTKRLFCMILLKLLYDYATTERGISPGVRHVTVIEEAWNVIPYRRLDTEPSIGERLFAELRKHGELLIAVTQFPSETAWSIMKNARLLILHSLPPKELSLAGVDAELSKHLSRPGRAVIVEGSKVIRLRVRRSRYQVTHAQPRHLEEPEAAEKSPAEPEREAEVEACVEPEEGEEYIRIVLP